MVVLTSEELPAFAVLNHHSGAHAINQTDGLNPPLTGWLCTSQTRLTGPLLATSRDLED